jgi:voltage-gated potassium channel
MPTDSEAGSEPRTLPGWPERRRREPASDPIRLADLTSTERRRSIAVCGVTVILSWVVIFGAYFVLPIGHESGFRAGVRLTIDIALVGAILLWQLRRISRAMLPELRAFEALGIVIAVFLVAFSSIYLAMSHEGPATFTRALDHIQALYFTVTVFSTVGFGDITPRTDAARLVVSAQMLLDLVIIGVVVRLLLNAARNRVAPGADATVVAD